MCLFFSVVLIPGRTERVECFAVPTFVSLSLISGILLVGILASVVGVNPDTAALLSPMADELERSSMLSYRRARRIVILVIGSSIILVGAAMVILPGPGTLIITGGFAFLAMEFIWAKRILDSFKKGTARFVDVTKDVLFK
ncbi:PGPGW domain-containing protein [Acidobacteriota bacterium]